MAWSVKENGQWQQRSSHPWPEDSIAKQLVEMKQLCFLGLQISQLVSYSLNELVS